MEDRWARLLEHLRPLEGNPIVLDLDSIEAVSGVKLPPYARKGVQYWREQSSALRPGGFRVTFRGVADGHVGFERIVPGKVSGLSARRKQVGRRKAGRPARRPASPSRKGASRKVGQSRQSQHSPQSRTSYWDPLVAHLTAQEHDGVVLTFDEIERIVGRPLPGSARKYRAFWYAPGLPWVRAGFKPSFDGLAPGRIKFLKGESTRRPRTSAGAGAKLEKRDSRMADSAIREAADAIPVRAAEGGQGQPDVILVGAGPKMRNLRTEAENIYDDDSFLRRRKYARASGRPWFILSALYGLVKPDQILDPYRREFGAMPPRQRSVWASRVLDGLARRIGPLQGRVVEIQAEPDLAEFLAGYLTLRGAVVAPPGDLPALRSSEEAVRRIPAKGRSGTSTGSRRRQPVPPVSEEVGVMAPDASTSAPRSEISQIIPSSRPAGEREAVIGPSWEDRSVDQALSEAERPSAIDFSRTLGITATGRRLSSRVTEGFVAGTWDLSGRPGAPVPGWDGLPEVALARKLRDEGASDAAIRHALTLGVLLSRGRPTQRYWSSVADLFIAERWVFDPSEVAKRRLVELAQAFAAHRAGGSEGLESAAWRTICETLAEPAKVPAISGALGEGRADVAGLLREVCGQTASGVWLFPVLCTAPSAAAWIRVLAYPGGAELTGLEAVPLHVDAAVRQVSEYLGMAPPSSWLLEEAAPVIRRAWEDDVRDGGAAGPDGLRDTACALAPALAFFARWGCAHCEREGRKVPVGEICRSECQFGRGR